MEAEEGPDEERAVGPGAGEADVEVEGGGRARRGHDGGEAGRGAGEGARGRVRGGELPHEEPPRGGPAVADGEDELGRGEGPAPQDAGQGREGVLLGGGDTAEAAAVGEERQRRWRLPELELERQRWWWGPHGRKDPAWSDRVGRTERLV